jgi:hypothetical protein
MGNVIKFETLEVDVLIGMANESAELVEASARKAVEQAERCGRALIAIKEKLQHGEWSAWLGQNFDYSQEHARRYMTIASNSTRVLNLKDATSIREALRMIADDPDTPKRECKPAVKVIEVAAEIVAADMPAVEVIEVVATVKPVAQKPTSPPKVSPPPPKIATAKVARLLESIVPARRARMEVILREEMKLWPPPAFEALGLILKEVVDEQLLLHGQ